MMRANKFDASLVAESVPGKPEYSYPIRRTPPYGTRLHSVRLGPMRNAGSPMGPGHYPNSCSRRGGKRRGEIASPSGGSGHRNTNSQADAPPQRRPADPRAPDRGRDRAVAQGHQGKPVGSQGRHDDPRCLPPWSQGKRADGPPLGSGGFCDRHPGTSAGSSRAAPAPIRSSGTSCVGCIGCSANRSRNPHSCLPRSAVHPSPLQASPVWSSAQARKPGYPSSRIRICCGTPAGSRRPTGAMIPGPFRPISTTRTFNIPCATPSCRRPGSRTFGGTSLPP